MSVAAHPHHRAVLALGRAAGAAPRARRPRWRRSSGSTPPIRGTSSTAPSSSAWSSIPRCCGGSSSAAADRHGDRHPPGRTTRCCAPLAARPRGQRRRHAAPARRRARAPTRRCARSCSSQLGRLVRRRRRRSDVPHRADRAPRARRGPRSSATWSTPRRSVAEFAAARPRGRGRRSCASPRRSARELRSSLQTLLGLPVVPGDPRLRPPLPVHPPRRRGRRCSPTPRSASSAGWSTPRPTACSPCRRSSSLLGKPLLPVLPPWGTVFAAASCAASASASRWSCCAQLRTGRGLDNRRLKASGFAFRYTTREAVLKLRAHQRLRPLLGSGERRLPLRARGGGVPAPQPERAAVRSLRRRARRRRRRRWRRTPNSRGRADRADRVARGARAGAAARARAGPCAAPARCSRRSSGSSPAARAWRVIAGRRVKDCLQTAASCSQSRWTATGAPARIAAGATWWRASHISVPDARLRAWRSRSRRAARPSPPPAAADRCIAVGVVLAADRSRSAAARWSLVSARQPRR